MHLHPQGEKKNWRGLNLEGYVVSAPTAPGRVRSQIFEGIFTRRGRVGVWERLNLDDDD